MDASSDILSRLLVLLRRSFVQYLRYAHPYGLPSGSEIAEVLEDIAADQNLLADRIAERLVQSRAEVPNVEFPLTFTDTNDLSINFLIERAIRHTRQDLAKLNTLADSVALKTSLQSIVDEATGMTQAHLESLEELTQVHS